MFTPVIDVDIYKSFEIRLHFIVGVILKPLFITAHFMLEMIKRHKICVHNARNNYLIGGIKERKRSNV